MTYGKLDNQPRCPTCNQPLDGYQNEQGHTPSAGDITVCVYCGEILDFTFSMELKKISQEKLDELDPETMMGISAMVQFARQFQHLTKGELDR